MKGLKAYGGWGQMRIISQGVQGQKWLLWEQKGGLLFVFESVVIHSFMAGNS